RVARPLETRRETRYAADAMNKTIWAVVGMIVVALAGLAMTLARKPDAAPASSPSAAGIPRVDIGGDVTRLAAAPHLLFRHTAQDTRYTHTAGGAPSRH